MKGQSTRQFTIVQLILLVTVAALGLVAMTQEVPILFALFATGTLVGFQFALLRAIFCRGASQAYWIGFVAWGLGYLLVFYSVEGKHIHDTLLTTQLLRWSYGQLAESILENSLTDTVFEPEEAGFSNWPNGANVAAGGTGPNLPILDNWLLAGQLLWAWFFAALGGWLAVGVFGKALPGREDDGANRQGA